MSQKHKYKIYILEIIQNEILFLKRNLNLVVYKSEKLQYFNC